MIHYRPPSSTAIPIFYREAGPKTAPAILLLHGFPTSSHMFRNLIPALAERYRVIAPGSPGLRFFRCAGSQALRLYFANLAERIGKFVDAIGLERFAIYIFDYGAPVGLRLALAHPDRITAIVSQNGNAYVEGLSEGWNPIQKYWKDPTEENRAALRAFLAPDATKWQYTHGVPDESLVAPETYQLDSALLARPGNDEIQLDLFLDYASNVALYPKFGCFRAETSADIGGVGETRSVFLVRPAPTRSVETIQPRKFIFSTPATSRWKRTGGRLALRSVNFSAGKWAWRRAPRNIGS